MGDNPRPRLSDPVTETLDGILEEYDLNTYDQAIRQVLREAGYDV